MSFISQQKVKLGIICHNLAGAAYMPLDVTYPPHLLLDIFDDAKPACILTSEQWKDRITGADLAN